MASLRTSETGDQDLGEEFLLGVGLVWPVPRFAVSPGCGVLEPSYPDNNPLTEVLALKTETIEATIEKWTKEPSGARGTPTVTARGEETQAAMEAGSFTWRADLPPALGGTNQAPSPTALLLSALAGCAVVFVRDTIAPQLGIQVGAVEATVKCETDARGLLGMAGAEPDLRNLSLEVSIESPAGEAAVAELSRVWHERCPIYLALVKPTDVAVQFSAV